MSRLGHQIIRASAGTGKTYALVTRYLALLAAGAKPTHVLALTFTRKAAGEFFEKIFTRLAGAALDTGEAKALAEAVREVGCADPPTAPVGWRALLRNLLDALPQLPLGTYDSFFGRIARTFPAELGLSGPPALLDDAGTAAARRRVSDHLCRDLADDTELQALAESFKLATIGTEPKRFDDQLQGYIEDLLDVLREAPDATRWGRPESLWPRGAIWEGENLDLDKAAAELARTLPGDGALKPAQEEYLRQLVEEIPLWTPWQATPRRIDDLLLAKCLPQLDALPTGDVEMVLARTKWRVPARTGEVLVRICLAMGAKAFSQRLLRTQGVHALLSRYDALYDAEVRARGDLTFQDITHLLAGDAGEGDAGDDPARPRIERAWLDYRLDGRYDHWLLDEFQDTSFHQWRAIASLVDELLQTDDGSRTLFAVGDVKQSIYLWRQSDPYLFDRVEARYGDRVEPRDLDVSHRSAPPVLAMVNAVFGGTADTLTSWADHTSSGPQADALYQIVTRWKKLWRDHRPAPRVAAKDGHAALLTLPAGADDEDAFAETVRLLRAIDPVSHGLTCAVLLRRNEELRRLAELARAAGLPVVIGADVFPLTDNALGALVESLLIELVHPGDTLATGHIALAGLEQPLANTPRGPAALAEVAASGFAPLIARWTRALLGDDAQEHAFSRLRASQLLAAAESWDAGGDRDVDRFLDYLRHHREREREVPGTITLLTIHKAKGLDWDVVVVPSPGTKSMLTVRAPIPVHRDSEGRIAWVSYLPPQEWRRADRELTAHDREAHAESAFEDLCALYVALTRARRALYVFAPASKSGTRSPNPARLLTTTLGADTEAQPLAIAGQSFDGTWSEGDPAWFEPESPAVDGTPGATPAPTSIPLLASTTPRAQIAPQRRLPSAGRHVELTGTAFFAGGTTGADHGTAVHTCLQRITWLPPGETPPACPDLPEAAVAEVSTALAQPAVHACFEAPATTRGGASVAAVELWRERSFEARIGDEQLAGVFDRVHLLRDGSGSLIGAVILDFKSDRVPSGGLSTAIRHHRAQLLDYRAALQALLGLPAEKVEGRLVFTHLATVAEVY